MLGFLYPLFSSFWDEFSVIANLILASMCGLGIFIVFYITHRKISVNRNFVYTLVLLPPVSAMVSIIVSNDIILAAGMLGALSIIRFRHSMKESKNLVFVFWAVTAGISSGLSFRMLTAIWFGLVAFLTLTIHFISVGRKHHGTIAVKINGDTGDIEGVFKEHSVRYDLKYKNINEASDVLYELKYRKKMKKLIDSTICREIMQIDGVTSVRFLEM